MIVLVSIGNSDNKLSQKDWSSFIYDMQYLLRVQEVTIHGEWFSAPDVQWQNANWMVDIDAESVTSIKSDITALRRQYDQDSVAWSVVASQEFI